MFNYCQCFHKAERRFQGGIIQMMLYFFFSVFLQPQEKTREDGKCDHHGQRELG
jgi:hypothetical protein